MHLKSAIATISAHHVNWQPYTLGLSSLILGLILLVVFGMFSLTATSFRGVIRYGLAFAVLLTVTASAATNVAAQSAQQEERSREQALTGLLHHNFTVDTTDFDQQYISLRTDDSENPQFITISTSDAKLLKEAFAEDHNTNGTTALAQTP